MNTVATVKGASTWAAGGHTMGSSRDKTAAAQKTLFIDRLAL